MVHRRYGTPVDRGTLCSVQPWDAGACWEPRLQRSEAADVHYRSLQLPATVGSVGAVAGVTHAQRTVRWAVPETGAHHVGGGSRLRSAPADRVKDHPWSSQRSSMIFSGDEIGKSRERDPLASYVVSIANRLQEISDKKLAGWFGNLSVRPHIFSNLSSYIDSKTQLNLYRRSACLHDTISLFITSTSTKSINHRIIIINKSKTHIGLYASSHFYLPCMCSRRDMQWYGFYGNIKRNTLSYRNEIKTNIVLQDTKLCPIFPKHIRRFEQSETSGQSYTTNVRKRKEPEETSTSEKSGRPSRRPTLPWPRRQRGKGNSPHGITTYPELNSYEHL